MEEPIPDPRVLQDFVRTDPNSRPRPFKAYPSRLPVSSLPRELPVVTTPATIALAAGIPTGSRLLDLPALARILYLSAGVVRVSELPKVGGRMFFRAAGSAGGRFPLELYLAARDVPGLADGVYWYHPLDHALVQIGPPPAGEAVTLIVTGVPWRTGWRYAERGYRHLYWDAGTLLAHIEALAASSGLPARLWTVFPDAAVTRLVGADGVHEFPLALVTLGDRPPLIEPTGPAMTGSVDSGRQGQPLEFPLITTTQHAGDAEVLGDPEPRADPLPPALTEAVPASPPLDEVILQRGSTRLMIRGVPLPRPAVEFAVTASARGIPEPQFIAVHTIDDLRPGLYRWPDLTNPVRAGDLRDDLTRITAGQHLAGDAAFVVLSCADLADLDDRGYRAAQLRAGLLEGRLHLAAFALGAGASGMTFFDSEIPALLGQPLAAMLFTCIGVPQYRNRRASHLPGRPEPTRLVTPRFDD